jgi:hypothetical protein
MNDPDEARRITQERITKLEKDKEQAERLADEERVRGEESRKNEEIARRMADDEKQRRLIAEAKAEALEREMSKLRANFGAG